MTKPEFMVVRIVARSEWYVPHYLSRCVPGDLCLLGELYEQDKGGFLCIRSTHSFVSLTPEQIWASAFVPWPNPTDSIKGFRINGNRVDFESS